MSKQDKLVVRRAEELERKYKFGAIGDTAREVARQSQALSGINASVDGLNSSVNGLNVSMQQQGQTLNQRIENLTTVVNNQSNAILDLDRNKVNNAGWTADKFLGTDAQGNVVEKEAPKSISLLDVYPVGAIYMSVDSTNPATLFGGTWERFANGRVLVGVDENDADFNSAQKTGGAKTNKHNHPTNFAYDGSSFFAMATNDKHETAIEENVNRGQFTPTNAEIGRTRRDSTWNTEISLLQPYITCYMWRRTA